MKDKLNLLKVSAPGRICLFGEHQDYLNLPVIASAISLRVKIMAASRDDLLINLDLPDTGEMISFSIAGKIPYAKERDYFRSSVNVLRRSGLTFSKGLDATVRGNIPINAGASSSSALAVAWVNLLAQMSDQSLVLTPEEIARYAYEAEVLEFMEPGGMMDQYSTALGGICFLDFLPELSYEPIHADLKSFVLGDSRESKDTKSILAQVKSQVNQICKILIARHSDFCLPNVTPENVEKYSSDLTDEQFELLQGTVRNHQITRAARLLLKQKPLLHSKIGELLNEHQKILRDVLKISTPKIDRMIDAALEAGALGAKINGSGGGGCMFAYSSEEPHKIAKAIENVGGKVYIVNVDAGSTTDTEPAFLLEHQQDG